MGGNITPNAEILKGIAATAAGTTTITGPTIDHDGARSVLHDIHVGTVTATSTGILKVYQGNASDMSDEVAVTGLSYTPVAGTDDGKHVLFEISKPVKRYSRLKFERGTANAVIIDGITILNRLQTGPIVQSTSHVAATKLVVPVN